ncbi:hypothetical protein FRC12_017891 [Ceratobasidium sp. 428]|nr:hypothetical protein FRC12_017891 [Ceratobasidium sp. 428]
MHTPSTPALAPAASRGILFGQHQTLPPQLNIKSRFLLMPLAGAVVLVYFTLERMRFPRDKGTRTEYQFYGNLVRVQVLKLGSTSKPAPKRKLIHGYGPDDFYGSEGGSTGEPAAKKPRIVGPV